MGKQRKQKKIIILVLVILLCWGVMMFVDYSLCKIAKPPVFSIEIPVTDQTRYRGLGYTIVLSYKGPVGMPGEQLQGYFYLGWR